MPNIQHKDIPDAQLHEPKGVAVALNKQIYIADGAASGDWRQLTEDDIQFSDKTKNKFGWNDISDNLYTAGAPLAISSGVRTQLPNNGLATQTDTSRLGVIWSSNQFLVNDLNATYIIRINCRIKAAAAAGTPYMVKFEVESANGPTVISAVDYVIKGGNYENAIAHTTLFYNGPFINNQALKIFVTPDTNITLYQIGFVVQRTYREL